MFLPPLPLHWTHSALRLTTGARFLHKTSYQTYLFKATMLQHVMNRSHCNYSAFYYSVFRLTFPGQMPNLGKKKNSFKIYNLEHPTMSIKTGHHDGYYVGQFKTL